MSKKPTVKELEQKIGELTQALQRERADAENLRRRSQEEKARLGEFYKAMIVQELLPALDNLERALSHEPRASSPKPKDSQLVSSDSRLKTWQDWAAGIKSVKAQFGKVFSELGVKRIKTVGEVFDPRLHEAVSMEDPSTSSGQEGDMVEVVCEELQPGYTLGDEVIRHAIVKVKMEKK